MADRIETVTLRLEDQITKGADQAGGALGRLERQIQRESSALGRLEKDLLTAKGKLTALAEGSQSGKAVAAFEKQDAVVKSLVISLGKAEESGKKTEAIAQRLAAAQTKLQSLKGQAEAKSVDVAAYKKQENAVFALTQKIGAQRDKLGALAEKSQTTSAALGQLGAAGKMLAKESGLSATRAAALGQALAAIGPYGAIAAGSILAIAGAISVYVGLVSKAISASGEMRSELLSLQSASVSSAMGMHWLFNATRESADAALRMQQNINKVNAESSLGRATLGEFAAQIQGARFQGKQAETVLRAMSIAGSGGSKAMAQEVFNWARSMRMAGGNVDDLAKRVEQKLGRAAGLQAIALGTQLKRLGENITWIFGGADIDPFLRALNSVLKLFNAGTDSATGMRNGITRMTEFAIGAMLRLGIAVLKGYIALRQHDTIWRALTTVVKYAAIAFGGVATVVGALVVGFVAIQGAIIATQAAIVGFLIKLGVKLAEGGDELKAGATSLGNNFALGMASGIASGSPMVAAASAAMAKAAEEAARKQHDTHSPSRVAMRLGGNFGSGMGIGIASKAGMVANAGARIATVATISSRQVFASNDVRPVQVPQVRAESSDGGKHVHFHDCTFGTTTKQQLTVWIGEILEGNSLASGKAA
jgi:hypothetical protein